MASTHYQRYQRSSEDSHVRSGVSGVTAFAIATLMLAVGIVIGSLGWLERSSQTGAGIERSSIAAPADARKYNDWRGNSAGIRQEPGGTN